VSIEVARTAGVSEQPGPNKVRERRVSRGERHASARRDRLVRYLTLYRLVALLLGIGTAAIWGTRREPAILAVAAAGIVQAAMITVARSAARDGQLRRSVLVVNGSVWPLTLVGAVVAPVSLPITSLSTLPAALLAVNELRGREVRWILLGAGAVTASVAVISRTTDLTAVAATVPEWMQDLALITLVPILVGLISVIGWQSHQVLQERADELASSRSRLLVAADRERHRTETELRITAQHRIERAIALLDTVHADEQPDTDALQSAQAELRSAITDLRRIVIRMRPAALAEHGLADALRSAAPLLLPGDDATSALRLSIDRLGRYDDAIEGALWFACLESIAAASSRAGPITPTSLEVTERDGVVCVVTTADVHDAAGVRADIVALVQAIDDRLAAVDGWAEHHWTEQRLAIIGTVPIRRTAT
jgi:signal transduction histidine kinase